MYSLKINEEWKKAKKLIPGGVQLMGKRAERFVPDYWPTYYKSSKGAQITDLEGNTFIDMSIMGWSCILGYADDDVNNAVKKVIDYGTIATLNAYEDVELAELLLELHPWAERVRYARTGGEAMALAVRFARAYTQKDKVALCGYHGWHDWYLATNLSSNHNLDGHSLPGLAPKGVPRGLTGTMFPFHYNNIEELEAIVREHDIGTIVMEPYRHKQPTDNFLQKVRAIANRISAVLVFDEISAGFRMNIGGYHLELGVNPDVAVFSKAMSNGFAMAAVIGLEPVMETAQETFVSSNYWTERIGPVAAMATIRKMRDQNVPAHLDDVGGRIAVGLKELGNKHGLTVQVDEPNAMLPFSIAHDDKMAVRTLFTQEMLKRGFLASYIVCPSFAHTQDHVNKYLSSVDEVFALIARVAAEGDIRKHLVGPVASDDFARLT